MNEDKIIIFVGNICPTKTRKNPNQGRVYDPIGIAPTLNCKGGGNLEPFVVLKANTNKGYEVAEVGDSINLEYLNSTTRRGRVGKQMAQTLTTAPHQAVAVAMRGRYGKDNIISQQVEVSGNTYSNALTTVQKDAMVGNAADGTLLIRKLTPKECFRLMGFTDKDVDMLIGHGISNTQLYKMAGNSIVVNVLEFIFCQIFDNNNEIWV